MSAVVVEAFQPRVSNTLRGFARVRMPSGLVFHDVSIHSKDGKHWASPASKPQVGRDGRQLERDGKLAFSPVVSFSTKELRDQFSGAVIRAVWAAFPEVFE